jgi:hypothetical protein
VALTNAYATLNQVKAAVRITDTVDDALLEMAVESASRLIDAECDRVFYNAGTAVRYFVPSNRLTCDIDDAITVTEVASDDDGTGTYGTVWAASDYQLEPVNGKVGGAAWPWTRIRGIGDPQFYRFGEEASVKVTATWGFGTAVPIMVTQACVIQAARIFKRLDSPLGVAGFGDMGAVRVGKTDPDVAMMLRPFKRIAVA